MQKTKTIPYEYRNLPIPGGGYVTGFIFHKKYPNILYARTDIGGAYRYCYETKRWISLMDHVTMYDLSESYPIAIGLDEQHPERLYIACGMNKPESGVLAISSDYGSTFTYEKIPVRIHGNLNGRGTGLRLIVSSKNADELYFASQEEGLLRTSNRGKSWETLEVNGEKYMTFVWQLEEVCESNGIGILVVGTAGVTTKLSDDMRGHSLYVSYDGGNHFEQLAGPISEPIAGSRMSGYVAQRYDYDGEYLYVTFSNTGRKSYVVENGYSCDSGDALGGKVLRYSLDEKGKITGYEDITPVHNKVTTDTSCEIGETSDFYEYGFSGIATCKSQPGLLVCTTICKADGDCIYISTDYGTTWELALYDLATHNLVFKTPYMKPQYNGNRSILHWLSDIKINPFNPDEAWFNSGTGIFKSEHLTSSNRSFYDACKGIEETVHLNVYSPPKGKVQLIDILGDLGGFAFTDVDSPCENSFADEAGNRYITCINADYSDINPDFVVVTPRGNWTGKTKGGLILSTDQCQTFTRLEMPFGLSDIIDERLHNIENPNINSGWVAVSPNCENIVWCIADHIKLPINTIIYSQDGGHTFARSVVYDLEKNRIEKGCMKVFSDRVDSEVMYGFGSTSEVYISHDGGRTFYEYLMPKSFPKVDFALIDCANKTEVRAEAGRCGTFYLALNTYGLWKMIYLKEEDVLHFVRLTDNHEAVYRMGLGVIRADGNYLEEDKAIYICGEIKGEYGFYRSLDEGKSWARINEAHQMFGDINSVEGDSRIFGRFFIATGSRGVLYGQPVTDK